MAKLWVNDPKPNEIVYGRCAYAITDSGAPLFFLSDKRAEQLEEDPKFVFVRQRQSRFSIFVLDRTFECRREQPDAWSTTPVFLFDTPKFRYSIGENWHGYCGILAKEGDGVRLIRSLDARHLCYLEQMSGRIGYGSVVPTTVPNFSQKVGLTRLLFDVETKEPLNCPENIARGDSDWLYWVIQILLPLSHDSTVHNFQNKMRKAAAEIWAKKFHKYHKQVPQLPDRLKTRPSWYDVLAVAELPFVLASDGSR